MGELIDFKRVLRDKRLSDAISQINTQDRVMPDPTELGWVPLNEQDGVPTRYTNFEYQATIGYVPGSTEVLYLDYRHQIMAWEGLTLSELAVGLETGTLPDHDYELGV